MATLGEADRKIKIHLTEFKSKASIVYALAKFPQISTHTPTVELSQEAYRAENGYWGVWICRSEVRES
jgi:hypothetical protein